MAGQLSNSRRMMKFSLHARVQHYIDENFLMILVDLMKGLLVIWKTSTLVSGDGC
jgi:hypothetical protein